MKDQQQRMRMDLRVQEVGIVVPHQQAGRTYYVLSYSKTDSPLYVQSTKVQLPTLLHTGDLVADADSNPRVVGAVFYTKSPCICEGTHLIAYSGSYYEQIQRKRDSELQMDLVYRGQEYHMFNQKNTATMVVVNSLSGKIVQNFEV